MTEESDGSNVCVTNPRERIALVQAELAAREKEALDAIKGDICDWLNKILGLDVNQESFLDTLDNGVELCSLATLIQQAAKDTESKGKTLQRPIPLKSLSCNTRASKGTFFARDNTSNFISWCRELGIEESYIFESDGLVLHRDEKRIILCLLDVARFADRVGITPPQLVRMEREIEELEALELENPSDSHSTSNDEKLNELTLLSNIPLLKVELEDAATPGPVVVSKEATPSTSVDKTKVGKSSTPERCSIDKSKARRSKSSTPERPEASSSLKSPPQSEPSKTKAISATKSTPTHSLSPTRSPLTRSSSTKRPLIRDKKVPPKEALKRTLSLPRRTTRSQTKPTSASATSSPVAARKGSAPVTSSAQVSPAASRKASVPTTSSSPQSSPRPRRGTLRGSTRRPVSPALTRPQTSKRSREADESEPKNKKKRSEEVEAKKNEPNETVDEKVMRRVNECTCSNKFQVTHCGKGKFIVQGSSGRKMTVYARLLSDRVMVRVGGGWDSLDHFLLKQDPCRMHAITLAKKTKTVTAARSLSPQEFIRAQEH